MAYAAPTAASPNTKASPWIAQTSSDRKMPSTAPNAAPADTPRMSGETSGFRNRPWYAAPEAASAPPTSNAARMRGPRMPNTTVSTVAGSPCAVPRSFDCITARSSPGLTG